MHAPGVTPESKKHQAKPSLLLFMTTKRRIFSQYFFFAILIALPLMFAPKAFAIQNCNSYQVCDGEDCKNVLIGYEPEEYEYNVWHVVNEQYVCETLTGTMLVPVYEWVCVPICHIETECWDEGDIGGGGGSDSGGDGGDGLVNPECNGHYEEIAIPHTDCQPQGYFANVGEQHIYVTNQDCITWYEYETVYINDCSGTTTPGAAAANDAAFVSQNVPTTMTPGQTATVSVTMRNIGSLTWSGDPAWDGTSNPKPHRLGTKNANNWGLSLEKGATGSNTARVDVNTKVALNQEHTFTFNITAPTTPGTYAFQWQMVQEQYQWFGEVTPSVSIVVAPPSPPPPPPSPVNNAAFVSQSIPTAMTPGQTSTISVTMKNTGSTVWDNNTSYPYSLGSQNPQDNMTWGVGRVSVGDTPVQPGQQKTFTFTVTAPAVPTSYNFQWRMVQDGKEWFGAFTDNVVITVGNSLNEIDPTTGLPYGMKKDSNGIPELMKSYLGLDPNATNDDDPRIQNLKAQAQQPPYEYDKNSQLKSSPERTYYLDEEGNIISQ